MYLPPQIKVVLTDAFKEVFAMGIMVDRFVFSNRYTARHVDRNFDSLKEKLNDGHKLLAALYTVKSMDRKGCR